MNQGTNKLRLQGKHIACIAMIALAWTVAGVGIFINAKNGQRLSIDADGSNLNFWVLFAVSIAPVASMSWAGLMFRDGKRFVAIRWAVLAFFFVAVNVWMAGEYLGDQMLGRAEQARDQKSSGKKIADMTNEEILRSKRAAEERLTRAIVAAKDPAEKKRLEEQLEHLRNGPMAFIAPSFDTPSVGARASWISRLLGWRTETVEGVTPNVVPFMMALVELFFSSAGFSQWPKPSPPQKAAEPSRTSPRTFGKPSPSDAKLAAQEKVVAAATRGDDICVTEWGGILGIGKGQASDWLKDFQRDGHIKLVYRGKRLIAVLPPKANGHLKIVPKSEAS